MMCLATPGKLIERDGDTGVVEVHGNRLKIGTVLTPEARAGDWVLVHAGFSITTLDEAEAKSMWDYVRGEWLGDDTGEIAETELRDRVPQEPSS